MNTFYPNSLDLSENIQFHSTYIADKSLGKYLFIHYKIIF